MVQINQVKQLLFNENATQLAAGLLYFFGLRPFNQNYTAGILVHDIQCDQ